MYEYRDLVGIDMVFRGSLRGAPSLRAWDLTATTFPDRSFAAIACLSVVEHGVDIDAYLREASRLLRPGGFLVTSTDFWCEPVDVAGREAYGGPVRIFGPADLASWVEMAAGHDLEAVRRSTSAARRVATGTPRPAVHFANSSCAAAEARSRRVARARGMDRCPHGAPFPLVVVRRAGLASLVRRPSASCRAAEAARSPSARPSATRHSGRLRVG